MRYILFLLLICNSRIAISQTTQPGLRDYQLSGAALYDSVLYIMGTDTLTASAKKGLGQWHRGDSLRNFFKDTDWLKYRTGKIPNNTDTAYHVGVVNIGTDSVFTGQLNLLGRMDIRYPGFASQNIAIGQNAINSTSVSNESNVAIGKNALYNATGVLFSVAIGDSALFTTTVNDFNFALGARALARATSPTGCTAIGYAALNATSGIGNVAIGNASGYAAAGSFNTLIGTNSGYGGVTNSNTIVGYDAGLSTPVSNNTFLGYQSGRLNTGSGNIFIGKESGENETGSNFLYIDNSNTATPIIHADMSADTLRINGDLSIRDAVSGASTDSVLVWTPSNGRVKMRNAASFGGSGATDLTIGNPSAGVYSVESSTGTDVNVTANPGISLSESPANQLVIGNTGVLYAENSSNATTHAFDLIDETASSLGTLTLTEGTGITLTTTGTTSNGIVTIASTISDTDDQNLTIEGAGPTYDIAINDGTDVTVAGGGIVTLSETPANTLVITATEVDGSTTNEIQDITVTGASQPFTLDLGSDASDATFTGAGITTVTRSSNALTFTSTEVDGSTTNETNTIEEGNVSVQTGNLNIDFQSMFDVAADGGTEVNISLDLSEATTVTAVESDDYMIMHDAGLAQHQKMLWTDYLIDLISFLDGNSSVGTGNAIDVGEGLDINMSPSTEGNINLDASEFQIDGTAEGTEYVLIHDIDTTAGHQIQRRLVSSFGGSDGNGIYDGSGTVPTTTVATLTDNLTFNVGASEADLYIDGTNDRIGLGTNSPEQQLTISNEDSNISYPIMAYHTDQTGSSSAILGRSEYLYGAEALASVTVQKKTSTTSNDAVLMIDMMDSGGAVEEGMDMTIKDTYTKNNPRITMYGAMQHSRVDSVGANTTLDESYFAVRCTTATITITLPNANTTNNEWIGTQYWIYNDSGGNITIDPNGTNDTVNGSNANITVADNAGYYLMLMSTSAGAVNNWMALKTP